MKINRKKFFCILSGLPFIGRLSAKPELPEPELPYLFVRSFDARVWAKSFVAYVHRIPSIPTDEGTMIGWFSNALMRGYDEKQYRIEAEARANARDVLGHITIAEIRGAVGRGWCTEANKNKQMDGDLAEAITSEILFLAKRRMF